MDYRIELKRLCQDIVRDSEESPLIDRAKQLLTEIDHGYNGWTNYETWNVKLWMDNEEPSYRYCQEIAREAWENAESGETFTRDEQAKLDLMNRLKEEYETAMADWLDESKRSASVWADLLGASLSEVNWHEIAEHMIDEVEREATADSE